MEQPGSSEIYSDFFTTRLLAPLLLKPLVISFVLKKALYLAWRGHELVK